MFRVSGAASPECAPPPRPVETRSAGPVLDLSPPNTPDWTFGHVDQPPFRSTVSGTLTVAGWALAADGVDDVQVLIDHRRLAFPVERLPGPDLTELFGPIAEGAPRFHAEIERPEDVPEHTDLQVRIVDESGEVTWLPQVWFTWREAE